MTLAGIERATLRFVAQYLTHDATAGPNCNCNYSITSCVRLYSCTYSIDYWTQRRCLTWKL